MGPTHLIGKFAVEHSEVPSDLSDLYTRDYSIFLITWCSGDWHDKSGIPMTSFNKRTHMKMISVDMIAYSIQIFLNILIYGSADGF